MPTTTYLTFGAGIAAFGAVVAYLSYFILFSVSFTALGIACVILGAATLTLPEHPVPRSAVRGVIHAAVLNVEALLEEFDCKEKATYMPPKDGLAIAFVPLSTNPHSPSFNDLARAPRRLVSEQGGVPVLMVVPPGAELVRANEFTEGSSLEDALQYVLVEVSELCSTVKAVVAEDKLVVEMKGVKVKTEAAKYLLCLGSIPASIAASVAATVTKKGLVLLSEETNGKRSVATFRLV
ncbi:MAG TPA: hypothetical protein VGR53_09925 [Nitrososphaerales archaeon]|nr:hypothetical protein [Nitrososphaerales archaeon]